MRQDLRTDFLTRQYMLSEDYELYFYSDINFKTGAIHTHPYYEFYFFVAGEVSLEVNGHIFPVNNGDLVIIPPGVPHRAIINDSKKIYQRFVFWLSTRYIDNLCLESNDYKYIFTDTSDNKYLHHYDAISFNAMQTKIFSIIQEINQERFGKAVKINILISDLLIDINRKAYEQKNPLLIRQEASLYQNLLTYIDNNLTKQILLEDIAAEFYVSKYHISHLFKDNLGISIHQYILKKRLNLFKDYLRETGDIQDAYLKSGFTEYSVFFRAFKKEFGISPSVFKKEIEKEASDFAKSKSSS